MCVRNVMKNWKLSFFNHGLNYYIFRLYRDTNNNIIILSLYILFFLFQVIRYGTQLIHTVNNIIWISSWIYQLNDLTDQLIILNQWLQPPTAERRNCTDYGLFKTGEHQRRINCATKSLLCAFGPYIFIQRKLSIFF